MPDRMPVLLDATVRQLTALLAAYGQRPSIELVRALRAKLAIALNSARMVGLLHRHAPMRSTPLPADGGGWVGEDEDTQPTHG